MFTLYPWIVVILSTSLDEMRARGNEYLDSLRSSHYYLNEKYNWVSEKHALKGNLIEVVFSLASGHMCTYLVD